MATATDGWAVGADTRLDSPAGSRLPVGFERAL